MTNVEFTLRMQGVRMVFTSVDGEKFTAVEGLNLNVAEGEIIAIVGKTGCGKSTTFNLLLGLDTGKPGIRLFLLRVVQRSTGLVASEFQG